MTNAGGPRIPTAGNPLGIGGTGSSQGMLPGGKLPKSTQANARSTGGGTAKDPLGLGK